MPDYEEDKKKDEPKGEDAPGKLSKAKTQQILEESKKRFKLCEEAEKDQREVSLEDLNFRAGKQWPEAIKQRMLRERKPCLTINVLPARERQVLNEMRQNRPAVKVSPIDGQATQDTADVLQGLIRHIEDDSDADSATDTAAAGQLRIGFGYERIITEFESPDSFDQVIKIERIRNAFDVYLDPFAQKADCSDAKHGHVFCNYSKAEYKHDFPNSELASLDNWSEIGGQHQPGWIDSEGARVAEYFCIEYDEDTAVQVQNAAGEKRSMLQSDYEKLPAKVRKMAKVVATRKTELPVVHWYKHNAIEILDHEIWPGQWIPIIKYMGDEVDVDGKVTLEGMVRHAKDPMRMQNYMASKEVMAIALAPNAPWVAAEGQTDQHPEWKDANTENYSVMIYGPSPALPNAGPPTRQVAEPPIQAITEARMHFVDDLKAVTGIYDAQLGAKSNEVSGTAIGQRKSQGQLSNFHYADNASRAIKFRGRQLIDLIPKIYSGPRMIRIIGEDLTQKVVKVNQEFQLADGSKQKYDLATGRYGVTVSAGPSYQTRRQETAQNMLDLTKAYPQLVQIAGDIIVGELDFPGHERLAERIKKTLPPGLADDPTDSDPKTQLASAQAKLQQLGQQHEQLVQALQHEIQLRETKSVEVQGKAQIEMAKIQANKEIELWKLANARDIAEITTKAQDLRERVKLDAAMDREQHIAAHDIALQKDQQSHEQDLAQQQAAQAQQQQATQIGADQQKQSTQISADQQAQQAQTDQTE